MFQFKHTLAAAAALSFMAATTLPVLAADEPASHHHHMAAETLDGRISRLHDTLHITDVQAAQWDAVAQVMRDNEKAAAELVKEKRQNEATMTAVDDLRAYQQIAEAHAEGVKKLAAAFETLYASLSPEQKAAADDAFRAHKRQMHHAAKAH